MFSSIFTSWTLALLDLRTCNRPVRTKITQNSKLKTLKFWESALMQHFLKRPLLTFSRSTMRFSVIFQTQKL